MYGVISYPACETKCTEFNLNWKQIISYSIHADKRISLIQVLERTEVFSPGIFSQDCLLFVLFYFISFFLSDIFLLI